MSRGRKAGLDWISGRALLFIWLPVLAVTVAHFGTPMEHEWLHDVLRRLYYIPIIVGAFLFGLRGAMLTSLVVTVLYLPHAFWMTGPHAHHHGMIHADPTGTANKILELVLYNVVALVTACWSRRSSVPAATSSRRSSRCRPWSSSSSRRAPAGAGRADGGPGPRDQEPAGLAEGVLGHHRRRDPRDLAAPEDGGHSAEGNRSPGGACWSDFFPSPGRAG
jgi:hypothetical protein